MNENRQANIGNIYWIGLGATVLIGTTLRLWGLIFGQPAWHPDEFNFVYWPLLFFEGDLNPEVFYYPHLLYYLLTLVYGAVFIGHWLVSGWDIQQTAALYYFWRAEEILLIGRSVCALFGAGTIVWIALIARRVYGPMAGVLAGAFAAVSVLGVRQATLAAADTPMAFFFCAAVWAALRLMERSSYKDYALAGLLVGFAAGTKYHGAIVGVVVLAAHWQVGRSLLDGRLWSGGLLAAVVFAATSPYILIDFDRFREGLIAVAEHTATGRGDLGPAWWYHIHFTLRHNLGWLGAGLAVAGAAVAWRNPQGRILLVSVLAYYLVISTGRLAFVRYALPLAALQCVLAAGVLVLLNRYRFGVLIAGLALCEPLYGAAHVANLLAAADTRSAARAWIEEHVPSGATLGNFGGWAGDVQLQTFEHLWWRVQHYELQVGYIPLEAHLTFFDAQAVLPPYYHYSVQYGNRQHLTGSMDLLDDFACDFAILHRHSLAYSSIDSTFSAALDQQATLSTRFSAEGLAISAPAYDPIDAYYVPLGDFGGLRQAGPEVEIWRIRPTPLPRSTPTPRQALGGAYMAGAFSALDQEDLLAFQRLSARALSLDSRLDDARYRLKAGDALRRLGRHQQALAHWRHAAALDETSAEPHYNSGVVHHYDLRNEEMAMRAWQQALAVDPDHVASLGQMAAARRRQGQYEEAASLWRRTIQLDPQNADAFYNLGLVFGHDLDDSETALAFWRQTTVLDSLHWNAHYNIAFTLYNSGAYQQSLTYWQQAADLRPDNAQSHSGLGSVYKALGQHAEAVASWQRSVQLEPGYVTAHLNLGLIYLHQLQQPEKARTHLHQVLALRPGHPQAVQIKAVLEGK